MKKSNRALATGIAAAMAVFSFVPAAMGALSTTASAKTRQPNIVFLMLDDTGYGEWGCYGNTFNETPNIDSIAGEGARFTQYYTQPVCSPSRGCLMTGNNPLRNGVTNFLPDSNSCYLNPDEFEVMPEMMRKAGYHTGIVGKWHQTSGNRTQTSPGRAENCGWDEVIMSEQKPIGDGSYFYPYYHLPQVKDQPKGRYLIDQMNDEAVEYIKRNKDEPFMLYFSHYATHTTLQAPQETVDYFQKKRGTNGDRTSTDRNPYLAAMLKHVDDGVGMIKDTLDELGLAENTIFVLTSDNGGETRVTVNGDLRGGKRQLYEGGIRDPMIMKWPAKIKQGKVVDYPVSVTDFYQTFGEAAGLPASDIPKNSGVSLMPIINGTGLPDRDTLYWCYPRNTDYQPGYEQTIKKPEMVEGGAIRRGDYKYLESFAFSGRRELYNLKEDPSETNNIISQHPEMAVELSRLLHEKLEEDTVGKTFKATFDGDESYRWTFKNTFIKENGAYVTSGSAMNVATVGDFLFYDANTQIDVKAGDTGRAGIILRSNLAGPNNPAFKAYAATVSAQNGVVELLNVQASVPMTVASAKMDIDANKTYKLKVVTDSDDIKIYLDNKLALQCQDESYLKGSVGMYSESADATFDNLTVTGVEGTRPVTDQQLNFQPEGDVTVQINDQWVWFDKAPAVKNGETLVQMDTLMKALGATWEQDSQSKKITAAFFDNTLSFTPGSKDAQANGSAVTLKQPAEITGGKAMVPLSFVVEAFCLQAEQKDGVISIDNQFSETVNFDSSRIKYTGNWSVVASTYRSSKADETAELSFNGTGVKLYVDNGANGGIFKVYIDGVLTETVDAYRPQSASHVLIFEKQGLEPGGHTIKLVNTGTHNAKSGGYNLNVAAFDIIRREYRYASSGVKSELILSDDSRIKYTGNWTDIDSAAAFGGKTKRSSVKGESCELEFEGAGIRLYLGRGTGAGILELYLDGKLMETIDSYNVTGIQRSLMYENLELSSGKHTVKVINTGNKNAAATAMNVNIDAFEVLLREEEPPQPNEDEVKAGQAAQMIAALPKTENLKLSDKADVQNARAQYNALTAAQKALVKNEAVLIAAEARITLLENAKAVSDLIEALPAAAKFDPADSTQVKKVKDANAAFQALGEKERPLVSSQLQSKLGDLVKLLPGDLDPARLEQLVSGGANLVKEQEAGKYLPDSYNAFKKAYDAAVKALAEAKTQSELDKAAEGLDAAIKALKTAPDKSKLQSLVEKAKKTDFSRYTDDTAAKLKKAIEDASGVLEDKNADQAKANAAISALDQAVKGLKEKSEPGDNSKPVDPEPGDSKPGTDTPPDTEQPGGGTSKDPGNDVPKTGRNLMAVVAAGAALGISAAVLALAKKRKAHR